MDKIKINLLPREVLEKRKAEQRLTFMILGLVAMLGALAVVFGLNYIRISSETATLDMIKTENEQVQMQIGKIEDFEKSKAVVDQREALVNAAIAGKYSWSRFLNNISLIVPNEVWLKALTVDSDGKLSFSGTALAGSTTSGIGHRPVAKWLVHLAELQEVENVWLSSSQKSTAAPDTGPTLGPILSTTSTAESRVTVDFETTAKIKSPESQPTAPAPPAPGGQI